MQVIIKQFELNRILAPLAAIANNKKGLPILRNVLLRSDSGVLKITGSDTEIELTKELAIESQDSFAITVEAQKLASLVATLPKDADVKIKIDDNKVRLTSGRSRFTLATLPAQDFPFIEMDNHQGQVSMPIIGLQSNIEKTDFAVAVGDVRTQLNGVLFKFSESNLINVATNGLRMAVNTTGIEGTDAFDSILTKKAVDQIKRLDGSNDNRVVITNRGNVLSFQGTDFVLNCTKIDAIYPDYTRVIPNSFQRSVVVNKASLSSAIKRAMILADDKTGLARLKVLSKTEIAVEARSVTDTDSDFADEIEAENTGGDIEIGFKASFMMDALSNIGNDSVTLLLNTANDAIQLSSDRDDEDSIFIVMPIRF